MKLLHRNSDFFFDHDSEEKIHTLSWSTWYAIDIQFRTYAYNFFFGIVRLFCRTPKYAYHSNCLLET